MNEDKPGASVARRPIPPGIHPPESGERSYTVAEFAREMGIAEITAYKWLKQGMPSMQPGGRKGRHFIYLSQVRQWANEFRCIGAAPGRTVTANLDTGQKGTEPPTSDEVTA